MDLLESFADFWLGSCVRRLPSGTEKNLYLTFDDGPDAEGTPAVLDLLAKHQAKATFFLIGKSAAANPELVRRMTQNGHAVGNHSLDHQYRNYFSTATGLSRWIRDGEKVLQDLLGAPSVGFRPPAGVRTPRLREAVADEPLILWSTRFYDSIRPWTSRRAAAKVPQLTSGSIVLLHDRQRSANTDIFLATLDWFLMEVRAQGFNCKPLNRMDCIAAMSANSQ